jgi:hypothetical protein
VRAWLEIDARILPRTCAPRRHLPGLPIEWRTPLRLPAAMDALDPEPLLRFLHEQGIAHILIGGVAVAAHG